MASFSPVPSTEAVQYNKTTCSKTPNLMGGSHTTRDARVHHFSRKSPKSVYQIDHDNSHGVERKGTCLAVPILSSSLSIRYVLLSKSSAHCCTSDWLNTSYGSRVARYVPGTEFFFLALQPGRLHRGQRFGLLAFGSFQRSLRHGRFPQLLCQVLQLRRLPVALLPRTIPTPTSPTPILE